MRGASNAALTIVEYGDFECPRCKVVAPVLSQIVERSRGLVRLVYRHFPLEDIHPQAMLAAEASECAAAQQQFWAMHDLLFENQMHLESEHLRAYAQRLKLDLTRYQSDIDDHLHLPRIRAHVADGVRSQVRSSPGLFLNGRIVDVSFGFHTLIDAVDRELATGAQRPGLRSG
jgi:protein-disulfide isomerase